MAMVLMLDGGDSCLAFDGGLGGVVTVHVVQLGVAVAVAVAFFQRGVVFDL